MFRAMFRQCSYFFSHFKVPPNPNQNPKLWAHRQRQLRVFSQNPFLPYEVLPSTNELADSGPSTLTPEKFTEDEKIEETQAEQYMDKEWGNRPSVWLSLFYDLAWTATFASLTENRQLQTPWDSASYVFFFVTAWWIWVSELFYSVDFYTDDWLHMICMALDLLIFGALATTTHDFDITAYINHAPGTLDRETPDGESMSPDLYRAQEVAFNSRTVITMVIAISRLLLLVKHLEVARHAKSTPRQNKPYPFRLLLIPASLFVSTALFFVAYKVTRDHGRSENGAQTMLILWGAALLVEGAAHIVEFKMHYYERSGLKLRSHGSIVDRFYGITIIIIGEGVNSIAGKLYSLEKAHGLGKAAVANIICCPVIVCFLAYLYFEGPNPLKPVRRRLLWAMTHLPWLLSVILLLEGIKEQILEMTMTYSANYSRYRFDEYTLAVNTTRQLSNPETKSQLQDILLQGGLSYAEEWPKFLKLLQDQASRGYNISDFDVYWEVLGVWTQRVSLSIDVSQYEDLFGDMNSIRGPTQDRIDNYMTDYSIPLKDWLTPAGEWIPNYTSILSELWYPEITTGRYTMALCGATLVSLASLSLIQSWPRDKFQWGSICSRYAIGIIMASLLLLNIGKYQTYFPPPGEEDLQAPIFKWMDENWIIPAITLAYAVQFIIGMVLLRFAVHHSKRVTAAIGEAQLSQVDEISSS